MERRKLHPSMNKEEGCAGKGRLGGTREDRQKLLNMLLKVNLCRNSLEAEPVYSQEYLMFRQNLQCSDCGFLAKNYV